MRTDLVRNSDLNHTELRCLDAIGAGARTQTAVALHAKTDLPHAARALERLAAAELIVSTGRQSWHLTPLGQTLQQDGAPDAAQRSDMAQPQDPRPDSTAQRLLNLLDRPHRGGELAQKLRVSRQRVHQLVIRLAASDHIRLGDPHHPMHVVARRADASVLLTVEEERLLSTFPCPGETTLAKLRAAAGMTPEDVGRSAQVLLDRGLIEMSDRSGGDSLYGLTSAGAGHEQRAADARHAHLPSLPVRSDRVRMVLAYFDRNGPTRTTRVGMALGISRNSINALMQYLKRKNLVRKDGPAQNAPHGLTPEGRETLQQMERSLDAA